MSITAIVINSFVAVCLSLSLIKDRDKTKAALLSVLGRPWAYRTSP